MWQSMFDLMNETVSAMAEAQQASWRAAARTMSLTSNAYARMWGLPAQEVLPADRRFKNDAWRENPAADLTKQAYLITARWLLEMIDGLEVLDPNLHRQAAFWTQQIVDAMSPTNFAATNPEVMQEAVRTGGMSLVRGWQNFLSDARQGRVSQVDAGSFEVGRDLAITPGKVVYRNKLIELIQYEPSTETVHAVPILVVPPWINKYYVMDMRPQNSLYRHLVDAGFTVFTISWKNPDRTVLDLTWDDYMDLGPLDALRVVRAITGNEKVNMVGYCLGGIILQVALAYLAASGEDAVVNTATYFTTHQDFSNAGDIVVFINRPAVSFLEWLMTTSGGYLDGRNMAATFNMLRANSLLWNYVVQNYLMGKEPPAFDLLYWNSDGTRVPGRVHSFLVRQFFLENKLMIPNGTRVKGVGVDLGRITTPTYAVAGDRDHIVPWQGAFQVQNLQAGPVRFVLSGGGHIAGIINPPADKKRAFWINDVETTDPDAWLDSAEKTDGSWWTDWFPWLAEQSGDLQVPPSMGNDAFPATINAPGTYVLEK